MLTPLTQTAISLLGDISGTSSSRLETSTCSAETLSLLLRKLVSGGLIHLKSSDSASGVVSSYKLCRPLYQITLLDVLEATGEHLNCNQPTKEELYTRFRGAANRLGVINQMTRIYLSEIKMTDF